MPFVTARYRTATGSANTALGGSSYGGLITLYAAIVRPELFGRVLLESPSLYVDDDHVLKDAAQTRRWPQRMFLGVVTNESNRAQCDPNATRLPQAAADVQRLEHILRAAGLDSTLFVTVEPCSMHNEAAWATRLPATLRFLFGQ